ncbi:MAG: hypothetical protein WC683_02180 [bacterium]
MICYVVIEQPFNRCYKHNLQMILDCFKREDIKSADPYLRTTAPMGSTKGEREITQVVVECSDPSEKACESAVRDRLSERLGKSYTVFAQEVPSAWAKKNACHNETPQRSHVSARVVQAAVPRIEALKAATVAQEAEKFATDSRGVNVAGFPGAKVRILKKCAYWSEKRGAPILVVELSAPDEPAWHRIFEGTPDEVKSFLSGRAAPNAYSRLTDPKAQGWKPPNRCEYTWKSGKRTFMCTREKGHSGQHMDSLCDDATQRLIPNARHGYSFLDPTNRCQFAWQAGSRWHYCTLHEGHKGEHYDSLTDKTHQR